MLAYIEATFNSSLCKKIGTYNTEDSFQKNIFPLIPTYDDCFWLVLIELCLKNNKTTTTTSRSRIKYDYSSQALSKTNM